MSAVVLHDKISGITAGIYQDVFDCTGVNTVRGQNAGQYRRLSIQRILAHFERLLVLQNKKTLNAFLTAQQMIGQYFGSVYCRKYTDWEYMSAQIAQLDAVRSCSVKVRPLDRLSDEALFFAKLEFGELVSELEEGLSVFEPAAEFVQRNLRKKTQYFRSASADTAREI